MSSTGRPRLILKVKSPFRPEKTAVVPKPNTFPGRPGSRWRDADGDTWMFGDDGRMWMLAYGTVPRETANLDDNYGPMTREGGGS